MLHSFSRLELGIGSDSLNKLKNKTVAIIGIGGVGSFAAEALARSAVGKLILVDRSQVEQTDINRQIHAMSSTIGKSKVELMKERILDINPQCEVIPLELFFDQSSSEQLFAYEPDYVVDAIDTIGSKLEAIIESKKRNIPIVSSMGAGNKLDPTQFQITDISKTYMDPVAKVIRHELKKRGINKGVKVVFSPEKPLVPDQNLYMEIGKLDSEIRKERIPPSSCAFVSPAAGLAMASVVINDFLALSDTQDKNK